MSDNKTSNCKGCGRLILWIRTKNGKDMPVDYPDEITIITKDGRTEKGFIPHWATCPQAKQFKKKDGQKD
ncbi:MAG: hypothetical protein PHQ35_10655 [Phycisphaerae bacterium]|nr:hypothetical protein [Phycisphaerae bacterium]